MVLKKLTYFVLALFVFSQISALQHDIYHVEQAFVFSDDHKHENNDKEEINHCEHCHVYNQIIDAVSTTSHLEFQYSSESNLFYDSQSFSQVNYNSTNLIRGPPQNF